MFDAIITVFVSFCAVFGGVYVLRRSIASVIRDENKSVLVFCMLAMPHLFS